MDRETFRKNRITPEQGTGFGSPRRNGDVPPLGRRLTGPDAPKSAGGSHSTVTQEWSEGEASESREASRAPADDEPDRRVELATAATPSSRARRSPTPRLAAPSSPDSGRTASRSRSATAASSPSSDSRRWGPPAQRSMIPAVIPTETEE